MAQHQGYIAPGAGPADDARKWKSRTATHQQGVDWLVAHPLLGSDDPLYEHPPFAEYTFNPGPEIEGRARIHATEAVANDVVRLRALAYDENKTAHAASLAMDYSTGGGKFDESSLSAMFGWSTPEDALRKLKALRASWAAAREQLLADIRAVSVPSDK